MKIEDKIIVHEIQNRNRKVFEVLFYEYYGHLLRYAEGFVFDRQVCEDIVQNLFVYFWENTHRLQIESIRSYFYQSVKNRCLNYLRDLHIHDKHNLLYIESVLNQDESADWVNADLIREVQKAIECLPEQMAAIFKLKYLDGKKCREIAEIKNISENTVKTQLTRAREKLLTRLYRTTAVHFLL